MVILIGAAFFYEGPVKDWRVNLGKPKNFFAALDASQISRIEIGGDNMLAIEREGESWKIAGSKGFNIKGEIIDALFLALGEAIKSEVEVASENPENKSEYGTDSSSGTFVKLMQAETPILQFIVGRLGNDFRSTYISKPDIDETFIVKANLNNALVRNDWYDRTIFTGDKDKITKIRFQYPTSEFTIEKNSEADPESPFGQWTGVLPYEFRVSDVKVEPILDVMSNLQAAEIPGQIFAGTGLEKNSIIVQATGEGIDNVLMVGEAQSSAAEEDIDGEKKFYYAKRGDSDNVYLITALEKAALELTIRDLR